MSNSTDLSCRESSSGSGEASGGADALGKWFGIGLGLAASIGINLGQNIQNSCANDQSKNGIFWWRVGFILFITSAITNFVAFAFAPASVLAPLEGAQFVTNFFYGLFTRNKMLYDNDGWRRDDVLKTGFGTALVVVGIVLPMIRTSGEVAIFDENVIWCFWRGTAWWIYLSTTTSIAFVCYLLYRKVRKEEVSTGERNKTNMIHMALFAIPSAIVSSFAVVQSKAISELIEPIFTDGDWSILGKWLFFQSLLFTIGGLAPWFILLNEAPKVFEVLAILPLMQGCYIIFSSLAGGIFFEEFDDFSTEQAVLFATGLSFILVGILVIITPTQKLNLCGGDGGGDDAANEHLKPHTRCPALLISPP
jgi:magnesium transporter